MLELISCFEMRLKRKMEFQQSRSTREALIPHERTLASPSGRIKAR